MFIRVFLLLVGLGCALDSHSANAEVVRVALITGGHGFDQPAFGQMFNALPEVTHVRLHHEGDAAWLNDISDWPYDVIVLYNMSQEITEQQRKNFIALLDRGVGLVVLHHAMVAYQDWPEFHRIAGAKYFEKNVEAAGKEWPKSTYLHDVQQHITVVTEHPVTKGITDFDILDETYDHCWYAEDSTVLLRTDADTSDGPVACVRTYAAARICQIQLGHDAHAYRNPNFQKLLAQAIHWTGKK